VFSILRLNAVELKLRREINNNTQSENQAHEKGNPSFHQYQPRVFARDHRASRNRQRKLERRLQRLEYSQ
jgi:hypothetical protein